MKVNSLGKIFLTLFITGVTLTSCNNDKNEPDKLAEKKNDEKFNNKGEKDAKALSDAYSGSLFEMSLSDSIKIISKNEDVRSLAASMAAGHSDLNNQIQLLAAKKSISLPTGLTSDQLDKIAKMLHNKKDAELNNDYVDALISDHKDEISMYEKAASDLEDTDIKSWFNNTLPTLRKHLDMANMTKDKLSKKH